jgi:eukaryotic-like serine/threonine-protein kinase
MSVMRPCINSDCNILNPDDAKFCRKCGTQLLIQDIPIQDPSKNFTENIGGGIKMKMISIPAGELMMGSRPEEGNDLERPLHRVGFSTGFHIGKYPVTQIQWQIIMGNNPAYFQGAKRPVDGVSWYQAQEFCCRLSKKTGKKYRLPSEAEWEYACRAGTQTLYFFGNDETQLGEYAWYKDNIKGAIYLAVGLKKPNPWGLYDLFGLGDEWCEDDWHDNYEGAPDDGRAWINRDEYSQNSPDAPKVCRSSHYISQTINCRSAERCCMPAGFLFLRGFRVVCNSIW